MDEATILSHMNEFASLYDEKGFLTEADAMQKLMTEVLKHQGRQIDVANVMNGRWLQQQAVLNTFKGR